MSALLLLALLDAGIAEAGPADGGVAAPHYRLAATLVADGAQPGDSIWLEVRLHYPAALAIGLPESLPDGRGMAPIGPAQRLPEPGPDASVIEVLRFPFVLLGREGVRSPAFTLRVGDDTVQVPALSLILSDAGPSPEPPDPELEAMTVYRTGPAPWVLPSLGLCVLALLLFIGLRRALAGRRETVGVQVPPIDAGARARARLAALRQALSDDAQVLKACWFELMDLLREYLDLRFGLHSLESTSQEMLAALAGAKLTGFPRVGLRALLQRADAVRYADAVANREAVADLLDQVEEWVASAEAATQKAPR
jgi:hypothetical protein